MVEPHIGLRTAWEALHLSRGMRGPDGSPLYAYRFERAEYDGVGDLIRRQGTRALNDPYGAALIVMYLAEWFRRERHGGGWDWVTPLNLLGIRYHASESFADVRYPELRSAIEDGMRLWRRPIPPRSALLLAVVRESGFPAADLTNGRLGVWLRRSVLAADAGMNTYDAVASEAWRAGETLVQALFDSAITLCAAVVRLRLKLRDVGGVPGNAIATLNALEPGWRADLPFDVEDDEFRRLVEDLVTARRLDRPALSVERRYELSPNGWQGRAEVRLDGTLAVRQSPPGLLDALSSYGRARLYPRGENVRWTSPIATLEREDDEDEGTRWQVRPLVPRFSPRLDPGQEVRIAALASEHNVAEFVPFGGEPLSGPVIALQIQGTDRPHDASELTIIGESPVRTTRPWLVLAVTKAAEPQLAIDGERFDFPTTTSDDRRLIGFSGTARLQVEGESLAWRTGAEREGGERLVLVGTTLRRIREAVFVGTPSAWSSGDERVSSVRPDELLWKPVGRGQWRSVTASPPCGSVAFALRRAGEIVGMTRASIVPVDFELRTDRKTRHLVVKGALDARIGARSNESPLRTEATPEGTAIVLGGSSPGATVQVTLAWEASTLTFSLDDPLSEPLLLSAAGRPEPVRQTLTLDRMKGLRLLTAREQELCFEGRSQGTPPILTTRTVMGSVPFDAYDDVVEGLLGSFEDIDAKVRLTWSGQGDWFAEVGRWEVDEPFVAKHGDSPFSVLAQRRAVRRTAFSLFAPAAHEIADLEESDPALLADRLRRDLAPGPWLLTGRRADGAVLRPKILQDRSPGPHAQDLLSALARVVRAAGASAGLDADGQFSASPADEDLRWLVDLCTRARSVGAPIASVPPLLELARGRQAPPFVLAACMAFEERSAVLDLQVSLPFLWCTTPIRAWQRAFENRFRTLRAQLEEKGLENAEAIAAEVVARALGHVAEATPVLATHVRACLPTVIGVIGMSGLPHSLSRPLAAEEAAEIVQRLVGRRADDRVPPLPGLAERAGDLAPVWQRFDIRFHDLMAAPFVAARIAAGGLGADSPLNTLCRTAWTWDRDYFDEAFSAALAAEAMAPRSGEFA